MLRRPERPGTLVRTSRTYGSARLTLFPASITAIYPGTYDPVTLGHVDVIRRAAAIFDRVVIGVVREPTHKSPTFAIEEARRLPPRGPRRHPECRGRRVPRARRRFRAPLGGEGDREGSPGYLGLPAGVSRRSTNRHLAPEIETVYVMSSPLYSFISSSGVKEIATFGGDVDELVPPAIQLMRSSTGGGAVPRL